MGGWTRGLQCQVHLLRLGHKRGRVLQDQTTRGKNDGRLRRVARRRRTVMSQVARSTTGGAAWARRTGMTAVRKRTGMTAASKRTGASSVGFFNNCLADDLGSMSTVPFGCLLLSLPIRVA